MTAMINPTDDPRLTRLYYVYPTAREAAYNKGVMDAARVLADDLAFAAAWRGVESSLPDGWTGPDVGRSDEVEDPETNIWTASASSEAYLTGNSEYEDEVAVAYGPTPAAVLLALAAALRGGTPDAK